MFTMDQRRKKCLRKVHPSTDRLTFIFFEASLYILCAALCAILMRDSLLKYTKGATTFITSWEDDLNNEWSLPFLTFCPRKGFRSLKYAYTLPDYNKNTFSTDDLFYSPEVLKKDFDIIVTSTALNGRCFTLGDKRKRKSRQEVIIWLKKTTDLDLYIHYFLEETVKTY